LYIISIEIILRKAAHIISSSFIDNDGSPFSSVLQCNGVSTVYISRFLCCFFIEMQSCETIYGRWLHISYIL